MNALASGHLGAYGTDVYENEAAYFFDDHSAFEMADRLLADLIGSPNFQLTGHQAFLTREVSAELAACAICGAPTPTVCVGVSTWVFPCIWRQPDRS